MVERDRPVRGGRRVDRRQAREPPIGVSDHGQRCLERLLGDQLRGHAVEPVPRALGRVARVADRLELPARAREVAALAQDRGEPRREVHPPLEAAVEQESASRPARSDASASASSPAR